MRQKSLWVLGAAALVASGCNVDVSNDDGAGGDPNVTSAAGTLDDVTSVGAGGSADTGASGGTSTGNGGSASLGQEYVYVETNDVDGNEVIAFWRASDGSLRPLPELRVATGGVGRAADDHQRSGPLDAEHPVVVTDDGRFLLAVNAGSGSVSVFEIDGEGKLAPVAGSPFPSGGEGPASIGLYGEVAYVVNKGVAGATPPAIAAFTISKSGALLPMIDGAVSFPVGASPSTAFVAEKERLVFTTAYFDESIPDMAPAGQLAAFTIDADGRLVGASGSPHALPEDTSGVFPSPIPLALGVVAHPTEDYVYVGFPSRNQLGVYAFNPSGQLSFVRATHHSGVAPGAFLVDRAGTFLYALGTASAQISTYDLTDAKFPIEQSAVILKRPGGTRFVDPFGQAPNATSLPHQLAFDTDQTHVYVLSQRESIDPNEKVGNWMHVLKVLDDGSLVELVEPIDMVDAGVDPYTRPQGVAVVYRAAPQL